MDDIFIIVGRIKSVLLSKYGVPTIDQLRTHYNGIKDQNIDNLVLLLGVSGEPIDWSTVWYELETQIQVKHEIGVGLDDINAKYDKSWFSTFKLENKYRYYSDRFFAKISKDLPSEVLYTLTKDTEQILNLCGSPTRNEEKEIRGLVFGFVQSGKTLNYTSVVNSAMDAGYNMIVILSGATNILRFQTQERIQLDLIGFDSGKDIGVGLVDNDPTKRPISLTTKEQDFDKKIAAQNMAGASLETVTVPVIAVIKKNVNALKNLNSWLNSQNSTGKLNKSILLIDDESDYASVNTRKEEDPTAINMRIREMLNHFNVSSYCAITATPFANVLIDVDNHNVDLGSDLFPKSFIWTLNKPSTYMGVNEIVVNKFVDLSLTAGEENIEESLSEIERILKLKKVQRFSSLPIFIQDALITFIYNSVKLRHNLGYKGDLSMMVNLSRFTNHHQELAILLFDIVEKCRREIEAKNIDNCNLNILVEVYKKFCNDPGFNIDIMTFGKMVEDVITSIIITDVHSESKSVIRFTGKDSINHIVVGGLSLSRGFTVEGLITSVFLRTTSTYDALMQMGRWFGHKQKFIDYISLYTTSRIRRRFEGIQKATEDLIDQLIIMREKGDTPKDFGLAIQLDPEVAMQVVAANKRRDAERITVSLSLEGKTCETTRLYSSKDGCINDELTREFIRNAYSQGKIPTKESGVFVQNGNYEKAVRDIPKKLLIDYVENFQLPHKKLSELHSKMPYKFLLDHLQKYDEKFDLFLVDGEHLDDIVEVNGIYIKKSKRKFDQKDGYIQLVKNQLSTGSSLESTFLNKIENSRINAAKKREELGLPPLLLLYNVIARTQTNEILGSYWAWSIIIPGDILRQKKKLVFANSVLLKQLSEDEGFEDVNEYFNQIEISEE